MASSTDLDARVKAFCGEFGESVLQRILQGRKMERIGKEDLKPFAIVGKRDVNTPRRRKIPRHLDPIPEESWPCTTVDLL